jgi:hypothetical protein
MGTTVPSNLLVGAVPLGEDVLDGYDTPVAAVGENAANNDDVSGANGGELPEIAGDGGLGTWNHGGELVCAWNAGERDATS